MDPTSRRRNIGDHGPLSDPSAPELSGVTTYTFRVIGGADSTAPSGGPARRRRPAPQQYRHGAVHCNSWFGKR